jgi:hypothetical protein
VASHTPKPVFPSMQETRLLKQSSLILVKPAELAPTVHSEDLEAYLI